MTALPAPSAGTATGAALVAEVTAGFLGSLASAPPAHGLYHLAPRGAVTWHGYAQAILEAARGHGLPLRVPPEEVRPLTTADYPTAARRPANSLLCTAKLESALAGPLANWQDDVIATVAMLAATAR